MLPRMNAHTLPRPQPFRIPRLEQSQLHASLGGCYHQNAYTSAQAARNMNLVRRTWDGVLPQGAPTITTTIDEPHGQLSRVVAYSPKAMGSRSRMSS